MAICYLQTPSSPDFSGAPPTVGLTRVQVVTIAQSFWQLIAAGRNKFCAAGEVGDLRAV
jgi:hypothetical protein